MPEASVRRDGTGNPDPRKGQRQLAGGIVRHGVTDLHGVTGCQGLRRYGAAGSGAISSGSVSLATWPESVSVTTSSTACRPAAAPAGTRTT
jgi:hypothetical protein